MHRYHFFVPPENIQGQLAYIVGDEFHHCCRVLRKQTGDHIIIFDGAGHAYRSVLTQIEKNRAAVQVIEEISAITPFKRNISLGFGLVKSQALDTLITQASALGVNDLFPLKTKHAVKQNFKKERYTKKALMTVKQAGNYWLPTIHPLQELSSWLDNNDSHSIKIITLQDSATTLGDIGVKSHLNDDIIILVGPEGGWHQTEIEHAQNTGFIPVNIYPYRLRTELAVTTLISELYMLKLKETQHAQ